MTDPPNDTSRSDGDSYWQKLFHRWFVEYNPLYLVSASLVLGGMVLLSRGLAESNNLRGQLGVAAIAELYAAALIGGAALLTRIGHRRPAVMLAMLTVVYQCDVTLHTETCPNLGTVGAVAAATWVALFVVKLRALAWAMRIRIERSAQITAAFGATGLALLPFVVSTLPTRSATTLTALWLAALVFLYRPRAVTSIDPLDTWPLTVLRRAERTAWVVLGGLFVFHLVFRSGVERTWVLMTPVLATRWMRGERHVWLATITATIAAALTLPATVATIALVSALALGWRSWRALVTAPESVSPTPDAPGPYRLNPTEAVSPPSPPSTLFPIGRAAALRLATGGGIMAYVGLWTFDWSGGLWPAHQLSLDLVFTAAAALLAWHYRLAIFPLPLTWGHFAFQTGIIPVPRSLLEWGSASIGIGFALLAIALGVNYRLRTPLTENGSPAARVGSHQL